MTNDQKLNDGTGQPVRCSAWLGGVLSPELIHAMKDCKRTWGMGFPVISDALLLPHLIRLQCETVRRFCEAVEREAENNMIKTGKLEGAHYAAMRRIRDTLTPSATKGN